MPLVRSTKARIGRLIFAGALLLAGVYGAARLAQACPFCSAVALTFCEDIGATDVAVIAKLVTPADPSPAGNPAELGKAKFEVVDVIKGDNSLKPGKKLEVLYFGDSKPGALMLITGVDPANINWTTPIAINERVRGYLKKALLLPKEGVERMVFFQDYLEDEDEILARDAYDEFAKTPYGGVKDLKDKLPHDRLIGWITNPKVTPSRRRLYLTMIGICGHKPDAELLEKMIRSDDRSAKAALDAVIAAYLMLKGPDGMPLVEDKFLKDRNAEYTETYQAIMALRFHGQEETIIPRTRLVEGLRYMLDRPEYADLVIPDLARWQDWGSMDRLVELFKQADDKSIWVRVPVINFLQVCPLPEAKERLAEVAKIDPDAMKKASTLYPVGPAARRGKSAGDDKKSGGSEKARSDKPEKDDSAALSSGESTVAADAASEPASSDVTSDQPASASEPAVAASVAQSDDSAAGQTAPARQIASRASAAGVRLSAAAPPPPVEDGPREVSHVLAWMALAGCVLGLSFWGILGAGRKTA